MTDVRLTAAQRELHTRLKNDYEFFSRHIQMIEPKDLVIKADEDTDSAIVAALKAAAEIDSAKFEALWRDDSTAGMVPYIMRPGQRKLHAFVEKMKRETGHVAAALVKPRQVGWSTYIQGRAHWLCTKTPGMKVLIVSHTKESTAKFLRRIRKMCAAAPDTVTPGRPLENAKEIGFINNAYISIATAGSPDAVRSDNAQFFHGSEETSWENEVELAGSIYPALSFGYGSEAYRETTSKGRDTSWHNFIKETLANYNETTREWKALKNRWRVFFDPYYNDPRYRAVPPDEWEPSAEALDHADQHLRHMTKEEQMARLYWRSLMIADLKALWLFKQEFPTSIDESFQSSESRLYPPDAVYKARSNGKYKSITIDHNAPLIMGVDPARTGDRTVIAFRQGNVIREILVWPKMDDMRLVGIIANFLDKGLDGTKVSKCFIDYAIGEGPASRLRELGYRSQIQSVHFGESSSETRYSNKRTEMFMNMRDWFGDTGEFVSIPDRDDIVGDLLAIPDFLQTTGSEKIRLESKDNIKKAYNGRSPDIADACALTFAYPVAAIKLPELEGFRKQGGLYLPNKTPISSLLSDFDS